jgi:hypothetical protein
VILGLKTHRDNFTFTYLYQCKYYKETILSGTNCLLNKKALGTAVPTLRKEHVAFHIYL